MLLNNSADDEEDTTLRESINPLEVVDLLEEEDDDLDGEEEDEELFEDAGGSERVSLGVASINSGTAGSKSRRERIQVKIFLFNFFYN